ncbi:uncharacterized protein SCHCODRAFT_02099335 [Schizophyllum commune H4-8]|uniref:uncharacterized protein n=1 Tax=Schizophyllum commune (strain H4-8 / FGSC 9210) TaxID=578458 RepID=UPI00216093ED|nr:uncharacterized protein SCHCODRAFT_02099335 [Schizophyllum commune H4-8]KAI5886472.1 hypothetical protein SCHCODRAFT_02099335 [Schizophyllum commune H4-8]
MQNGLYKQWHNAQETALYPFSTPSASPRAASPIQWGKSGRLNAHEPRHSPKSSTFPGHTSAPGSR